MDAIELLTKDHQEVRGLFERFRSAQEADDTPTMAGVVDEVFQALETHTTIEEEIFYPAVRGEDEEMDEQVDESLQEHHVVDVLITEMRRLDAGDDEWVAKMTVLMENVEHHAEEEEQELFPAARQAVGDGRLQSLGEELETRRATAAQDLTSRRELYEKAQELEIEGRSTMSKRELAEAVAASAR